VRSSAGGCLLLRYCSSTSPPPPPSPHLKEAKPLSPTATTSPHPHLRLSCPSLPPSYPCCLCLHAERPPFTAPATQILRPHPPSVHPWHSSRRSPLHTPPCHPSSSTRCPHPHPPNLHIQTRARSHAHTVGSSYTISFAWRDSQKLQVDLSNMFMYPCISLDMQSRFCYCVYSAAMC
jgi:hypothetical protein